jgi:hypothetical protein
MNNEEVNRIIAEFMGGEYITMDTPHIQGTMCYFKDDNCYKSLDYYVSSLDALVPVLEKLENFDSGDLFIERIENQLDMNHQYRGFLNYFNTEGDYVCSYCDRDTRQEAAAHATAKAIKELSNE